MSTSQPTPPPAASRRVRRVLYGVGVALVLWFALAEGATRAWYAWHESRLPRNALPESGDVVLARLKEFVTRDGGPFQQRDVGTAAMDMLKCSFGQTIIWNAAGAPAAVTILKWSDSSVVGGTETLHNPGICLAAAGWGIGRSTHLGLRDFCGATADVTEWEVTRGSLTMRAFSAIFRRFSVPPVAPSGIRNSERLDAVLSGRRDAPVFIILAYLPVSADPAAVNALFDHTLRALFCSSNHPPK